MKNSRMWMLVVVGSALALFACGGGGGGGTTTPAAGTVSGTVVKGPVSGATVHAFGMNGGAKGAQLGTGTTDANGNFTIPIGDYAGPVMLQAGGGTYTDEATGNPMTMQAADVMTAAIPAVAAGGATSGIQVTPMTAMAQARAQNMTGGMTAANIATANSAMGAYFSVSDVLHVAPMNPLVAGSGNGATQDQKNYGMAIAAMSQYARTLGMTASSGIVTAMMTDASDGVMNGMMGSTPISMTGMGGMMGGTMQATAGTTGLATAMRDFVGSAMNRSGVALADMQSLVDRLAGSNGQLPGAGGGTTGGSGTMSGTAFMGTMSAGTVTAFAIDGGTLGAQMGSAPVDSSGNFSLPLGSFAGPVMLRMTGGAFVDEATGATMTMLSGDELTAGVPSVAAGATTSGVQITPLTSMAQARAQAMSGGMTAANLAAANAAVASFFMVDDLLTTPPMDPAKSGSGTGADQSRRSYGMTIGAMSQYAKTIGMTDSSSLVTVMMSDASDGVMNGMMGSTPIAMGGMGGMMGGTMMQPNAGTVGLATAMTTFVGSSANRSGVTISDMQALIDRLSTSSGTLQ